MRRSLLIMIMAVNSIHATTKADWREDLNSLLTTSQSEKKRDELIEAIAKAKPDWQDVIAYIRSTTFPDADKGRSVLKKIICTDGVERPYVVYVPSSYNPKNPAPLLVILHGSVSRVEIIENPREWADKTPYIAIAEQRGWFLLFPMGQAGATWWEEVGMSNILNQVRAVKGMYNIDDDRAYLGGFSDGGSGAFLFAMAAPNDFGAFVSLNGHMGVASEDGDLPTYATNFANTPVYAVTTDKDQLYPSASMEKLIDMARRAGGDIFYRQLEGEHSMSYASTELPLVANFLERHPRNPFPNRITWETATRGLGVCRWFAIDSITNEEPAPWHGDYNTSLIDSMIIIGFQPDDNFGGPGVKVESIVDEDYLARRIGLRPGDIIIKGNDTPINTMDDLSKFKTTLRRGGPASLTVKRDTNEVILQGRLPAAQNYYVFKRSQPSARANVSYSANKVWVEMSRVGSFTIFVSPEMFNLNDKISIYANNQRVFNARIQPDIRYILRNFLNNRDRKVIYTNEIKIAF